MNTTTKITAFIFAFMLVGAGCLGGDKAADTKTDIEPEVEVTQPNDKSEDVVATDKDSADDTSPDAQVDPAFKMVKNPQPATTFDLDDFISPRSNGWGGTTSIDESQVLKLDLDGDGSLEYAAVYTVSGLLGPIDNPKTDQYVHIFKWNGAEWKSIFFDSINKDGGLDEQGWFNQYEVTRLKDGNHVLYLEKANGDGPIESYHFGQLPDGSFGKL